jgi:glycosyltransferase involved in cell wall biosynthesis
MTPLNVCFVSLKAYDLLAGAPHPRHFGGAERQQVLLARGLAERGHRVTFVTLDYGQAEEVEHKGIRAYRAYAVDSGAPGLRFFHPRWTGLASAMSRAKADIYYQMGADSETGQVGGWCSWQKRPFVFCLASDGDCDPELPLLRTTRQRRLYRYGLGRARAVVSQTDSQRIRLQQAFGIDSLVIPNCTPDRGFDPSVIGTRLANPRTRVLWVGRFNELKRLELLLDLAQSRPDWEFHVVGKGDPSRQYVRDLEARAAQLPNVTLHKGISDEDLHTQYLSAHVLVCTSSWEGVPTTFLEAWARAIPVVSTIDPDGIIVKHGLGVVSTPEGLPSAIETAIQGLRGDLGMHVRRHFLATYTVERYVTVHESLFESLRS